MKIEKQLVTPQIAEQLLKSNNNNRRVRNAVVQKYANEMIAGRWKSDTGETMKISKVGNILDGQHRLLAVIRANMPIYFHIAVECDDDIFDVIDSGSLRNSCDSFHIKGIKHDNILPSIITTYITLGEKRLKNTRTDFRPTTTVVLNTYYNSEEDWQQIARKSASWYVSFAKILPPSLIGGIYAYLIDIDYLDATSFMNQLATGNDCHNSINLLRRKLMQDKISTRRMTYKLKIALTIKTWNYFRNNEKIKILKFDSDREPMPIAV